MLTTYRIISNFQEIGECEGIPDSDYQGTFVLFSPKYYRFVNVGDSLVSPSGEYLSLYFEDPISKDGELIAFKLYYK